MSKANNFVFTALQIIAWVIFVGLCIEAGALLVNFVISLSSPDRLHRLYTKLDLSAMYAQSQPAFFSMYSFMLVIAILKAVLFYVVIVLVSKLDLSKPFNSFVLKQISRIGYFTLAIGLLGYMAQETAQNLARRGFNTEQLAGFWADSQAFILMAAVVYVIAAIFRKGLEIQAENDLTV